MKFVLTQTAEIEANVEGVWAAWSNVAAFPEWDPREIATSIDGPFQVGATGWSKQRGNPRAPFRITAVAAPHAWSSECPLPGGRLEISHLVEEIGGGRVRVTKTYTAHGPMTLAFRLHFGRRIRKQMPASFAALGARARHLDQFRVGKP